MSVKLSRCTGVQPCAERVAPVSEQLLQVLLHPVLARPGRYRGSRASHRSPQQPPAPAGKSGVGSSFAHSEVYGQRKPGYRPVARPCRTATALSTLCEEDR